MRPLLCAILLAAAPALAGCAAWSTYPPIEGAAQIGHPKLEPAPTIMAEAVRYAHERYRGGEELVFNLPEGAAPDVYESVQRRLRGGRPMTGPEEPAIHIKQVRIRAVEAEVDVIYPRADVHYEMVTLRMRQRLPNRYEVTSTRLWRIAVQRPAPTWRPPVEQEIAAAEDEDATGAP